LPGSTHTRLVSRSRPSVRPSTCPADALRCSDRRPDSSAPPLLPIVRHPVVALPRRSTVISEHLQFRPKKTFRHSPDDWTDLLLLLRPPNSTPACHSSWPLPKLDSSPPPFRHWATEASSLLSSPCQMRGRPRRPSLPPQHQSLALPPPAPPHSNNKNNNNSSNNTTRVLVHKRRGVPGCQDRQRRKRGTIVRSR